MVPVHILPQLFVRRTLSPKIKFNMLAIRKLYTTVDEFVESSVNMHSVVVITCLTASTATPYTDEAMSAAAPIPADWRMLGPRFLRHG